MALAVVTGGAGALGYSIARALGRAGNHVLLVDISDRVEGAANALNAESLNAAPCVADIGGVEGVGVVKRAVEELRRPVTTLVNNAGINRDARADVMTDDDFRAVVRVNLVGPALLCDALSEHMDGGGAVVNISSRAALGNFGQVNYVAAKSGLVGLTRALALRWAPRVRVNAIAPGLVDTPMTAGMPAHVLQKLVARVPAGRIGTADEIAEVVAFLASPAAAYITGQFLPVCGGRSLA